VPVTNQFLEQAGINDGAQLLAVPPQRFASMFGADAILFVTIESWDTSYYVLGGNVTVGLTYRLVSTKTSEPLWGYHDKVVVDTSGGSGGGGLIGALVETAVKTATQDYFPIAQQVNSRSLAVTPHGKYHPSYDKDESERARGTDNIPVK
jgi:hypothetical protein